MHALRMSSTSCRGQGPSPAATEKSSRPTPTPQSPAHALSRPAVSPIWVQPQSPAATKSQLMNRRVQQGRAEWEGHPSECGAGGGRKPRSHWFPLPLPSPTSPGFQFSAQQRRFEHGSPSYIQVTSLSQQVQTQSPAQPSPGPGPACRACGQVPPRPGLALQQQSHRGLWMPACQE